MRAVTWVSSVSAILLGLSLGAVPAASAAVNPNQCSVAYDGNSVKAYCAVSAGNGFYRAVARCDGGTILQGPASYYIYGNLAAPGGTSKATCSAATSPKWKSISFQ